MKNNYLTVTALTKYIKRKIDTDPHLKNIWLKGEISNFKHHSRGHMYLTIKDEQSRMQAVMFAGNNRSLKFNPENGMNVLIKGEISVFEAYGQYQLYIQQMEPDGVGALFLAFEQLKVKLHKLGYFDDTHKKEIPLFPKHIGIVTSPTGAAVRDIITTLRRRYPIAAVTVLPVLVQGPNAANSIKNAIELANEKAIFDVLIVGRGGGSIEELWSFNEEIVAEAVFQSKIPIISAVGHETDVTICDYVADLRAATPTGAAELAVQSQDELKARIVTLSRSMTRELDREITTNDQHLQRIKQSYAFRYPEQLLKQKEQELDKHVENVQKTLLNQLDQKNKMYKNLYTRFKNQHPENQMERSKKQLNQYVKQQSYYINEAIKRKSVQLSNNLEKLTLLNPLETMKRGFAVPYDNNGEIIKSYRQVKKQDIIKINLMDGNLSCKVLEVEGDPNE
ncbi:exodeoxyribonuclease VII large subunit [Virgibacillus sp. C22-A2]|uniref:Exodeoxyribonuclease 7 large subunit n=1 Tax=Virgibacillus tibetensis TaxID=3042313 RepID=A0ABU6KAK7_9BACI|nr:exodeoxyribonuclease VII large subunit [Virgibacillus sp. C22-A2]